MSNMLSSSIGKKLLMALAGLFLCVFLLVHLTINLLILLNDGGVSYMAAAGFMSSNVFIKIFEVVLFGGMILHILYGAILQIKNWMARPSGYAVTYNSQTSYFSKYMIHTGAIILVFLVLHFINFYFVKLGFTEAPQGAVTVADKHDFYSMVINLFSNKLYSALYIAFMLFLGFHLNHALQSAFQTIGINHPKYNSLIKSVSTIYSIIVAVGFSIIPVYFMFFYKIN